jgi:outer membrane murein-binding lipoprotein Lpp
MEARSVPPPRRGRPLTPEEEDAERERFELGERLQAARRWAYFATFVAFLAAAGAGVALAWALEDDGRGRPGASRSAVRDLQGDVGELRDQTEAARDAGLEAQDSAESLSGRVDDLESRVTDAGQPDEATQQQLEDLSQDVQQLQEDVDQARQDARSSPSPSP